MSIINPFAMHYQSVWVERAKDPALPQWVRLAAIAFGKHRRNGHANFDQGELARVLATPGADGTIRPLSASAVSNLIRYAKNTGWIAETSHSRCLVVPAHAVEGGLGHPWDQCRMHAA